MGELVTQMACPSPDCGSSDAYTVYRDEDGGLNAHCYSCGISHSKLSEDFEIVARKPTTGLRRNIGMTIDEVIHKTSFGDITPRGISQEVAEFYGVRIEKSETTGEIDRWYYPLYVKGKHVGFKYKTLDKTFGGSSGVKNPDLFGKAAIGNPRKMIVITEGEDDAMAARQMFLKKGKDYAVVSLPNGANKQGLRANVDWLEGHQHIVLCFDQDEPGKKIRDQAIDLFSPGKVKVMTFSEKDANDMLKAGKTDEFYKSLFQATAARPDGIVALNDSFDDLYEDDSGKSVLYPWKGLNDKTYGARQREIVTITAGSGVGKSAIVRELEHHLLKVTGDNIGILALEESVSRTKWGIISIEANLPLSIREERAGISKEEVKEWYDATIGTDRLFAYSHFGSTSEDNILSKISYMIKALDCKWIFLDHLSIIVSAMEQGGDERRTIDSIMTKLRMLVESTGVGLFLVSHLRRTSGDKGHESGLEVNLSHLRGSQAIAQLSDMVLAGERNQQADDDEANTTTIRVLKNRYAGITGRACHLFYDRATGRLRETFEAEVEEGAEF